MPTTQLEHDEAKEKLRVLRCVMAGWAFSVPPEGREDWLDQVVTAILGEATVNS